MSFAKVRVWLSAKNEIAAPAGPAAAGLVLSHRT
jgi:hypothetical protein